jgi:hypothetical protein
VVLRETFFLLYCDVEPIKCCQGSKTNKSNCQFGKKSTYNWLVDHPSQDLVWPETTVSHCLKVWAIEL